jgi:hypothetical protein
MQTKTSVSSKLAEATPAQTAANSSNQQPGRKLETDPSVRKQNMHTAVPKKQGKLHNTRQTPTAQQSRTQNESEAAVPEQNLQSEREARNRTDVKQNRHVPRPMVANVPASRRPRASNVGSIVRPTTIRRPE